MGSSGLLIKNIRSRTLQRLKGRKEMINSQDKVAGNKLKKEQ
jgi:hypothetical protein